MTYDELHILTSEETRCSVEHNIERTHIDVALDKSLYNSRLVATQVKYLQRAKDKLPSYYAARCILTQIAYEQSSSEATALHKREMGVCGESLLDLTCGLGVESFSLSSGFRRVIAVERDEVVAEMAQENFKRLGASNIEVHCSSAEEFVKSCTEHFDWVIIDPDRRGADGSKRVLLDECSPNILAMMDRLRSIANRVVIKLSPLFDCDEARRLFEDARVEVVSLGGECKEVVIYIDFEGNGRGDVIASALGIGSVAASSTKALNKTTYDCCTKEFSCMIIPDVSLQKSRLASSIMSEIATIDNDNSYAFATEEQMVNFDPSRHLGRVEQIEEIIPYEPKRLRRKLAERGVKRATILKRNFPYSTEQIKRQLKIDEGGAVRVAFTTLNGENIAVILK